MALGTEVALPLPSGVMGSAFVEGRVGDGDFQGVWGGLRLYFGQKSKPLIARHRRDDPNIWGLDTLFSIVNNANQTTLQSFQTISPLSPPPPPPPPPPEPSE